MKRWLTSPLLVVLYSLVGMILLWPAQRLLVQEGRDIRQDYLGSLRLFARIDLYSRFSQAEFEQIDVIAELGMPLNFHPPTTLFFFAPLAYFDFGIAVFLWGFISLLAFFASLYLIMRELGYGRWFFLSLVLVFWFPLWLHIRFGQFSILILLFLTLFWLSVRRDHQSSAGFFLGLASLVKIFPLVLLLLLMLKRQWRALLVSLATIGVVSTALFLYYPEGTQTFLTDIAPANDEIFRTYFGNFSVNGFVGRLFHGTRGIAPLVTADLLEAPLRFALLAMLLLISVLFALKVDQYDLCLALFIVVMLIVSPTTWAHAFVILLLPGFILWHSFEQCDGPLRRFLLIVVLALSCFPHWHYYEWLLTLRPEALLPSWLLLTSPGFYVLLGMLVLVLVQGVEFTRMGSRQVVEADDSRAAEPLAHG